MARSGTSVMTSSLPSESVGMRTILPRTLPARLDLPGQLLRGGLLGRARGVEVIALEHGLDAPRLRVRRLGDLALGLAQRVLDRGEAHARVAAQPVHDGVLVDPDPRLEQLARERDLVDP